MELNCGPLRNQPLGKLKHFIIDVCAVYWALVELNNESDALATTTQVRTMFEDLLSVRWLCWLSYTARTSVFGWLPQTRLGHGAKLTRWRDKVR